MPGGRPRSINLTEAMPIILRLFWHDGYGASTLEQVASELGVTKPTLCRTLGEKEAMFSAALEEYHRVYIAPAEAHLEQAPSLRLALEGVFGVFVERILDDDLPAGCFLGDSGMSGDFGSGLIADTIGRLQGGLAARVQQRVIASIAEGELLSDSSPSAVVPFILGQFSALSAISRVRPDKTQLKSVVSYMIAGLPWAVMQ